MNVHWWNASTSVHPKTRPHLHLLVDAPISAAFVGSAFHFLSLSLFVFLTARSDAEKGGGGRKLKKDRDRREKQEREEEEHPHHNPPAPHPLVLHPLTTFLWGLLINQPSISIMPPKLLFVALRGRNNQYVLWGQPAH